VICAPTEAEVAEVEAQLVDRFRPFVGDERAGNASRIFMKGTPEQLIEQFEPWRGVGMDYAIIYFPDAAYDTAGLDLFASEVIPALAD
jgi:alkanesulfonate monooxygenase SsuD/methylene tetrahydromethanopterin reductase-like flavin-dependent oxidoreductase (luciferase family)